ncbi:MAG: FtsX-like permease family protein [Polyangia bacterium]
MRISHLALRNLGRNKRRSLVTGLTVAFGVFAIVFLQSFVNAMLRNIVEVSVESKVGAVQVFKSGYLGSDDPLKMTILDTPELTARIRAVPGVAAVAPRLDFDGMLSNGSEGVMFLATAIDPAREYAVCPRRATYVAKGTRALGRDDGEDAILAGATLVESLEAKQGSSLVMQAAGAHGATNALDVTVQGFLRTTQPSESKRAATVTLAFAQKLLRMPGTVSHYVVGVHNVDRLDEVAARLRGALGPGFQVTTWRDLDTTNATRARIIQGLMFAVTSILFLLVLTGIVNTMLMSVYERIREIGTMLAVGARRRQIRLLFLCEAAFLALSSALLGTSAGALVVALLGRRGFTHAFGPNEPVTYYPAVGAGFLLAVVLLAVLGSISAALYPAWKGSRLHPAEALRTA